MTARYWYCEECDQLYRESGDLSPAPLVPKDHRCSDCGDKLSPYDAKRLKNNCRRTGTD